MYHAVFTSILYCTDEGDLISILQYQNIYDSIPISHNMNSKGLNFVIEHTLYVVDVKSLSLMTH